MDAAGGGDPSKTVLCVHSVAFSGGNTGAVSEPPSHPCKIIITMNSLTKEIEHACGAAVSRPGGKAAESVPGQELGLGHRPAQPQPQN